MNRQHIHVVFDYPPIPDRSRDWCAYFDGEEERNHYGHGATPEEALSSLRNFDEADTDDQIRQRWQANPCLPVDTVCFFRDGNQWCAVHADFINPQESDAGFGDTLEEAMTALVNGIAQVTAL